MINYKEGDIIKLALAGEFDVIAHGVNCFCKQKSGLAPQMVKAFGTDTFRLEGSKFIGDIKKLGNIDYMEYEIKMSGAIREDYTGVVTHDLGVPLTVVNAYTQYRYGRNHSDGDKNPLNYSALSLCMQKINHIFAGKHIGLPKIGAGLAGGDWDRRTSIPSRIIK